MFDCFVMPQVIRVAFHSLNLLINYDGRDPGVIPVYYQPPFSLPPDDLWDKIAHRKSLPLSALAKDLNTDLRRGNHKAWGHD